MEAKNHLACVAGARKGKVEGKPKSGARARRDAERREGRGRGWGGGVGEGSAFLFPSPLLRALRAFRARIISPSPFLFLAPATQAKNDFLFNNDY